MISGSGASSSRSQPSDPREDDTFGSTGGPFETARGLDAASWGWLAGLTAVLVYLPSLQNGFAYDDIRMIVNNPFLRDWSSLIDVLGSPYWRLEGVATGLWRPTTSAALVVLWNLGEGAALPFHIANILLHGLATVLVVRVFATAVSTPVAALAGIVFAVHPVHVEAVANGVGIAELLAAVFTLGALLVASTSRRLGLRLTLLVWLLFLLGFGSKESAVVLPGLIFVVDCVRWRLSIRDLGRWIRDRGVVLLGIVGIAVAMLVWRAHLLGRAASAPPAMGGGLLTEVPRIWTLGEIWYHMLRVVTVPTWLSPDYAPNVVRVVTSWTGRGLIGLFGVLAILSAALAAAAYVRARQHSTRSGSGGPPEALALGVAWFVVAVSPVSNVVVLTGVLFAERTMYLPSAGSGLVIASVVVASVGAARTPRILRLAGSAVLAVLLLAWGVRTVTYIPTWRDSDSVFRYMVWTVPESGRSKWLVGNSLIGSGDVEGALTQYRAAIGPLGRTPAFMSEAGLLLLNAGEPRLAIPFLERANALAPGSSLEPLAVASLEAGDFVSAEGWARAAAEAQPDRYVPWYVLSQALRRQQRWQDAADALTRALANEPERAEGWVDLSVLRARAGDSRGAMAARDRLLRLAPAGELSNRLDSLLLDLEARSGG